MARNGSMAMEKTSGWYRGARYDVEDLWKAAFNPDINALTKCLKAGLSPNYCRFMGSAEEFGPGVRSIADVVAYRNDAQAMRLLLQYKVDLSGRHTAARWGSIQAVLAADRASNSTWTTPLHVTCTRGWTELARVLLTEGHADINAVDSQQRTPLTVAIEAKSIDIASLLLNHGASLDLTSALSAAASDGTHNMMKLLTQHGARFDSPNANYGAAFHGAAQRNDHVDVVAMAAAGANIDSKSGKGESAFFSAASNFNVDGMDLLLRHGADVDARDINGCTPLHRAVMAQNLPLVKCLLHLGADIDAEDNDLWTPLYIAMIHDDHDIVATILNSGAHLGESRRHGDTALHQAARLGSTFVVRHLLALRPNASITPSQMNLVGETPLFLASKYGHGPVAKLLLKYGASPHQVSPDGYTALDSAMYWGSCACVVHLVESGARLTDQAALAFHQGKQEHPSAGHYDMILAQLRNRGQSLAAPVGGSALPTPNISVRNTSIDRLKVRMREKQGKVTMQDGKQTASPSNTTTGKTPEPLPIDPFEACIPNSTETVRFDKSKPGGRGEALADGLEVANATLNFANAMLGN